MSTAGVSLPFSRGLYCNVTMVFEVEWTELHHILQGRRTPIIDAPGVQIHFLYIASFRHENDIKRVQSTIETKFGSSHLSHITLY